MPLRYEVGFASVAAATGAAYASFNAPTRPAYIKEIGVFANAGTASPIWLCRGANSIVQTSTIIGNPLDAACQLAASGCVASTWSIRRGAIPATAGAGMIWTFPDPLIVQNGSAAANFLVLWNPTGGSTASVLNCYFAWME
jgi:hypothetical protein